MKELIKPKPGYTGLTSKKIGRNEKCGCGSGKKAKNCHGTETEYFNRKQINLQIINNENNPS